MKIVSSKPNKTWENYSDKKCMLMLFRHLQFVFFIFFLFKIRAVSSVTWAKLSVKNQKAKLFCIFNERNETIFFEKTMGF
jgi:hypothetical protein